MYKVSLMMPGQGTRDYVTWIVSQYRDSMIDRLIQVLQKELRASGAVYVTRLTGGI